MADTKDALQFLERGGWLLADVRLKFGWIELAPVTPTGLGSQCVRFGGGQIAINRAFAQPKELSGLSPRAAPQPQTSPPAPANPSCRLSGPHPIIYTANVYVKCYSAQAGGQRRHVASGRTPVRWRFVRGCSRMRQVQGERLWLAPPPEIKTPSDSRPVCPNVAKKNAMRSTVPAGRKSLSNQ